ncbi:MAG: hypothetical protein WC545_03825 [Patescibacteria group bacterium]
MPQKKLTHPITTSKTSPKAKLMARKTNRQDNILLAVSSVVMLALVYLAALNIFSWQASLAPGEDRSFFAIFKDSDSGSPLAGTPENEQSSDISKLSSEEVNNFNINHFNQNSDAGGNSNSGSKPSSGSDEPGGDDLTGEGETEIGQEGAQSGTGEIQTGAGTGTSSESSPASGGSSGSGQILEPAQESEPESMPEPTSEPIQEPNPEPEPIIEPILEPESVPEPAEFIPDFVQEPEPEPVQGPEPEPAPTLVFGSFFNTFSSDAALNLSRTDLYQDTRATAMIFEPDYSWQEAASVPAGDFSSPAPNSFTGPYLDRRCLNANCLEQRWNELYYNNEALAYPSEVDAFVAGGGEVAAVSFFTLSERWVVGFTLKKGSGYQGFAYYFDGQSFTPIITASTTARVSSSYFGLFGGGGTEDDFLLIYGAYKGIAYRVRGGNLTDISKFFDIRAMIGGFKPEAIRLVRDDSALWYVYSSTLSRQILIKLWQNGGSEIAGETIFRNELAVFESVIFKLKSSGTSEVVLSAKASSSGVDAWYSFTDRGFKNNSLAALEFDPVSRSRGDIEIEKISASRLALDAPSLALSGEAGIKFLFSSDGVNWQTLPLGADITFPTGKIASFFLRVVFPSFIDKFYSPFLDSVTFNYYYH